MQIDSTWTLQSVSFKSCYTFIHGYKFLHKKASLSPPTPLTMLIMTFDSVETDWS